MIDRTLYDRLMPNASMTEKDLVIPTLRVFGEAMLEFTTERGIRIELIGTRRYIDCSPGLNKAHIDVDRWPNPPAGLFVLEERTAYLRSISPMTIAHEFGHAFDCAVGHGSYYSLTEARVRRAYTSARKFITPYAAISPDEYFAEAFRAWFECNDRPSAWPPVSRAKLRKTDQYMYECLKQLIPAGRHEPKVSAQLINPIAHPNLSK